jgi:hypothetical protein
VIFCIKGTRLVVFAEDQKDVLALRGMVNTMQNIWEKRIDMSAQNIYDYVWRYEDYLDVLSELLNQKYFILGGDILNSDEYGVYGYSSCSWYYEGGSCCESNEVARKYLERIKGWAKKEKLLVAFAIKNTMLIELMLKNLALNGGNK